MLLIKPAVKAAG